MTKMEKQNDENASKIMTGQVQTIPSIASAAAAKMSGNESKQIMSLNSYIQSDLSKKVVREVTANVKTEFGAIFTDVTRQLSTISEKFEQQFAFNSVVENKFKELHSLVKPLLIESLDGKQVK